MEKNTIDYLRLSITDWCNLNCIYCTPLEKKQFLSHADVLRYEETVRLTKLFTQAGIRKVRITGGEPLIKKGIIQLITMLKQIPALQEISMTTNGVLLKQYADQLKQAGLSRINISLDTLKPDRFLKITGKNCFHQVWKGIEASLKAGLNPIKLNVIPMKGVNDDEIIDFAKLSLKYPLIIRFIEFFHTNQRSEKYLNLLIPSEKVKNIITEKCGTLHPVKKIKGYGPADYYTLDNAKGKLGFISGSTTSFCDSCNRLRVDCAGKVSPCLFSGPIFDIRPLLRSNTSDEAIVEEIKRNVTQKSFYTKHSTNCRAIEMSSLGG
ncbi:MAG: GTP 3',8-cyclase MoaA [Candidatus Omnitrophica bacterium]|nr:GTP 3',8-cyclase MoaA [Candidatus Omnitrophota bacterium]